MRIRESGKPCHPSGPFVPHRDGTPQRSHLWEAGAAPEGRPGRDERYTENLWREWKSYWTSLTKSPRLVDHVRQIVLRSRTSGGGMVLIAVVVGWAALVTVIAGVCRMAACGDLVAGIRDAGTPRENLDGQPALGRRQLLIGVAAQRCPSPHSRAAIGAKTPGGGHPGVFASDPASSRDLRAAAVRLKAGRSIQRYT
jgi:hypothetical protein